MHYAFSKDNEKLRSNIKIDIEPLKNDMDEWEKQFWTAWVSHSVEVDFGGCHSIADRRGELRYQYSRRTLEKNSQEERSMWDDCIVRAFKDIDTVEKVKKLRQDNIEGKSLGKKKTDYPNYKESVDIEHMKHLLDIFDRHRRGELTSEDIAGVKENFDEWNKDIEKIREMISSLHN